MFGVILKSGGSSNSKSSLHERSRICENGRNPSGLRPARLNAASCRCGSRGWRSCRCGPHAARHWLSGSRRTPCSWRWFRVISESWGSG